MSKNLRIYFDLLFNLNNILHIYNHPSLCQHNAMLFLVNRKAHKTPTQSKPCKELKIPIHSPPITEDGIFIGFKILYQQITLLNTKAHPPPHNRTDTITIDTRRITNFKKLTSTILYNQLIQ